MPIEMSTVETGNSGLSWKEVVAAVVGLLALVCFAWFVIYMLKLRSAEETEWSRAIYLFSGAEAIAFAAAGFFFGREVNRTRADKAEKEYDKAKEQSDSAQARAIDSEKKAIKYETGGKTLKTLIKIKSTKEADRPDNFQKFGVAKEAEFQVKDQNLEELVALAEELFP